MNLNKRAQEMKDFFNEKIEGYDELHLKLIEGKEKIIDYYKDMRKDTGTRGYIIFSFLCLLQ